MIYVYIYILYLPSEKFCIPLKYNEYVLQNNFLLLILIWELEIHVSLFKINVMK